MDGPPPPPPPHGADPNTTDGSTRYRKSTDLPDGNYDIFVIPPHSAGAGFLYLPSLQCHRNSFIAGSLSTLLAVVVWITVLPTVKSWFATTVAPGGMGILVLVLAVGFGGWYWSSMQADGSKGNSTGGRNGRGGFGSGSQYATGQQNFGGGFANGSSTAGAQYSDHQYNTGNPPPQSSSPPPPPPPPHNQKKTETEWERAREETKRKEDIRRKMEEYKKKREAEEAEKKKQRDREAMEKEFRERKQQREKEVEAAKEKAEKEAAKKEAAARFTAAKDAAAKKFAAAKEAAAAARGSPASAPSAAPPRTPSPNKPLQPTAKTATEDDAYSFRPYDRPPRRPYDTSAPSVYSESSYAPSQSTARTTPPPSNRGPYFTKDPDKVVIRGVYAFTNAFQKTPVAQLVSGQGSVTDGLVLRITTEGLFVDDDVRGIAQREWDVKAWTMKVVEVWCPLQSASSCQKPSAKSGGFFRGVSRSTLSSEGADAFLADLSNGCKNTCQFASSVSSGSGIDGDRFSMQTAEFRGLHVVRASLRDQEGKKYVFVLPETESWKVAIGLQSLRRGSQVRALNVAGMPANETKAVLANLGYI